MSGSSRVMMSPCRGTTITCPLRPGKYPRANISRNCARDAAAAGLASDEREDGAAAGGACDARMTVVAELMAKATMILDMSRV